MNLRNLITVFALTAIAVAPAASIASPPETEQQKMERFERCIGLYEQAGLGSYSDAYSYCLRIFDEDVEYQYPGKNPGNPFKPGMPNKL